MLYAQRVETLDSRLRGNDRTGAVRLRQTEVWGCLRRRQCAPAEIRRDSAAERCRESEGVPRFVLLFPQDWGPATVLSVKVFGVFRWPDSARVSDV